MKGYRLLVDWDVVAQLRALPSRTQRKVYALFSRLEDAPDSLSEFTAKDKKGRELDVFIVDGLAFYYWVDFADRHVKVLSVGRADDPPV